MSKPVSYKRHRFPPEIIAHAVWLYFRFPLSLRLVEEMLLERGIVVSYETVRRWALKFGPDYTRRLRRKTPSRRDIWHLDEVVVTIAGQKHWLWRAVSHRFASATHLHRLNALAEWRSVANIAA
jgi:putative transposase